MDQIKPEAHDVAYDDIVTGMREQDEYRTLSGMAGLAHAAVSELAAIRANVGRIADAIERIADNTAKEVVSAEPSRSVIGIPAERD